MKRPELGPENWWPSGPLALWGRVVLTACGLVLGAWAYAEGPGSLPKGPPAPRTARTWSGVVLRIDFVFPERWVRHSGTGFVVRGCEKVSGAFSAANETQE